MGIFRFIPPQTYEDMLAGLSHAEQDEVLGRNAADKWRSHGMTGLVDIMLAHSRPWGPDEIANLISRGSDDPCWIVVGIDVGNGFAVSVTAKAVGGPWKGHMVTRKYPTIPGHMKAIEDAMASGKTVSDNDLSGRD